MLQKIVISLFICLFSQAVYSQVPVLTFSSNKEQKEIYLKTKTTWITATPFFIVKRKFSPDQGKSYIKIGMFGQHLKNYVNEDSCARHNLRSYKYTRIFGLAQMGIIAPLLAYKHFSSKPQTVSTGNPNIDNNVLLEEESGYLAAAIIVFCTGTLTYHLLSKNFLFRSLERYNFLLSSKIDSRNLSINMNMKLEPTYKIPQLSLIINF